MKAATAASRAAEKRQAPLPFKLLLLGGSLLLALILAEVVVRLLPDETLGFVRNGDVFVQRGPRYKDKQVNSLDYHDVEHAVEKSPGVRRVLLLGDSYVRAGAVTIPQTPGQRMEHYLNAAGKQRYEVIAIGWGAWGQLQELEMFHKTGKQYSPDVVVSLFLSFNDVENNSDELTKRVNEQRRNTRHFRPGRTRLSEDEMPGLAAPWSKLNQLLSFRAAYLLRDKTIEGIPYSYYVYAVEEDAAWSAAWRDTLDLFSRTRAAVEDAGARYLVVAASTPHGVYGAEDGLRRLEAEYPGMSELKWDLDKPDRRLGQYCEEQGIPFLALEPAFRVETIENKRTLHIPVNGHWNEDGNDYAAMLMAEFLLENERAAAGEGQY